MRARDRLVQALADLPRRMADEDRQYRDRVIAEFGGVMQALADEMVRLRRGIALLAEAIDWMKKGAPFGMIPPGPHWKPRSEDADGR